MKAVILALLAIGLLLFGAGWWFFSSAQNAEEKAGAAFLVFPGLIVLLADAVLFLGYLLWKL